MSGSTRRVVVAATIGAVEALKDQGICRWNYTFRSLHQHFKNDLRSALAQSLVRSPPAGSAAVVAVKKPSRSEASMNKVVELNSWGPSTIRF